VRFSLIDRITELRAGESIVAVKALSLAEEYLADHFPRFPVMPGVMMLESMFQASAWLVRRSEDFAHSIVVLREARNVKFSNFVEPGQVLVVKATIVKQDATTTTLKAEATVDEKTAVSAKLVLERYNLADRYPTRAASDAFATRRLREQFALLDRPVPVASVD
jgi:3-hydroxyacyl-[acyl-carrier-protein] dehydratase